MHVGAGIGRKSLAIGMETAGAPNPMAGVTKDATSSKYLPASAGEWATTATAASITAPSNLWLGQEPSGNLADSIGSNTMVASGIEYQHVVAGWAAKGWGGTVETGVVYALSSSTFTGSLTVLCYVKASAPSAARGIIFGQNYSAQINNTPAFELDYFTGTGNGLGAADPTAAVHPLVMKIDYTGSVAKFYSDQEAVANVEAFSPSDGALFLGGAEHGIPPNFTILYAAAWSGAAAEMSDAQVRTLLQKLGWTVAW